MIKQKTITFKKKNGRYELTPKERIISLLKKNKHMAASAISRAASIQYNVMENIIDDLQKEGLAVVISSTVSTPDNKIVLAQTMKMVYWKGVKQ